MVALRAQVRGELDTARALGSLLLLLLTPRIADLHRHAINLGRDTLPCQYAAYSLPPTAGDAADAAWRIVTCNEHDRGSIADL